VPEELLHHLDVGPFADRQGGASVPQIVQSKPVDTADCRHRLGEGIPGLAQCEVTTTHRWKHQRSFFPIPDLGCQQRKRYRNWCAHEAKRREERKALKGCKRPRRVKLTGNDSDFDKLERKPRRKPKKQLPEGVGYAYPAAKLCPERS
jgi:hypothetical protein